MLKYCIYLTLLLVAVYLVEERTVQEEEAIIRNFIQGKCLKNGGENAYSDLEKSFDETWGCIMDELGSTNPQSESEMLHIVCTEMPSALHSCFNIILEKVDHCLDDEEKYFPNFMSEWFNLTFSTHCEGDGEVFKEHYEIYKNAECKNLDPNITETIPEKCFSKSTLLDDFQNPDYTITKGGLCGYLGHANQCFIDFVTESCGEFLANHIETHLKPTKIWCDKYLNDVEDN
ncbi:hypothetical protein ILUMI_17183 [Ignelater luminosus]|uniref:DUF19 domain-containing protein n=1 Tax=Ignelater luminosus TaxID=2038154 RepID=A0A8K0G251_IGNLU|nr:hypothetical protein ILUMI_17183 [Ignelater luminosus]